MRIWIFGAPGSGKTTLARRLACRFALPHHELDQDFWLPGWRIRPAADFVGLVHTRAAADRWVFDGNYTAARPILSARATFVIWLDLPFHVTYPRVLRRSAGDAWAGRALCGGNRETLRRILSRDGMPSYALRQHRRNRSRFQDFWDGCEGAKLRLTRTRGVLDDAVRACGALSGGA